MTKQIVAPARRWRVAVGPILPALTFAGLLSACCGGGDAGPAVTGIAATPPIAATVRCAPPAGVNARSVVGGTIIGRSHPSFILVSPGGGLSYLFYGPDLAATSLLTGYILISGGGGSFPGDPRLYNGSYTAQAFGYGVFVGLVVDPIGPVVTGSLHYHDPAVTYQVSGGPVPGSSYHCDRAASVGDVVGTWNLTDMQANSASLSVSPDGGFSGSYQGCTLAGTLKPVPGPMNQLAVQATLTGCPASRTNAPVGRYDGFAIAFPMDAGGTQFLIYGSGPDETNWSGDSFVAIGRR